MNSLSEEQVLLMLVAVAVILLLARGCGELARRIGQPEVIGEFVAGFLLGPSVLGLVLPNLYTTPFTGATTGFVLSGLSWLGVILLLLIAGLEVDLPILRSEMRIWSLAAAGAILPALAIGTLFGLFVLRRPPTPSLFLGIVLSVTAVSVAAKILIEREALRRRYAQVMLAAGVASEILVWLMVSVVDAVRQGSPLRAIASAIFAMTFFALALTLGRYVVFAIMRYVADSTDIVKGQLTLVLVLMLIFGAITLKLGLHPLLGAFVFGVLLSQAPRATSQLRESIQTLTIGFFAPIFFALAGMRVDLLQLGSFSAIGVIVGLFVVATLVKVGLATLGARLGGLRLAESALVGVGLNLKGGTDVIVAIIGVELGLFAPRTYTIYAVVAVLTVLLSPPALAWLERKAPPSSAEQDRLAREEAERRAYVPTLERVLVPLAPALLPGLASAVVERLAHAKHAQGQLFDVTQLATGGPASKTPAACEPAEATAAEAEVAKDKLEAASTLKNVVVGEERAENTASTLKPVLDAAKSYDLIAMGACPEPHRTTVSFGRLQDAIIQKAQTDILIVSARQPQLKLDEVRRILVPVSGLEYSMAAGDIAASLAAAKDGERGPEVVLLHVVAAQFDTLFWREQDHQRQREVGMQVVSELEFRVKRLGVTTSGRVRIARHPWDGILTELRQEEYQLLVMGGYNRSGSGQPYLGATIHYVLARSAIPAVLLLTRQQTIAAGEAA